MMNTKRTTSLYSQDDPLAIIMCPYSSETDLERRTRLRAEADAKRVSEKIDEELRQDREKRKKIKNDVKLLLLGQAESGKSTLQKQFQLMYNPNSLDEERASWRIVVYFNVIHTLKLIFAALKIWEDSQSTGDDNSIREFEEDDSASIQASTSRMKSLANSSFTNQPSPNASLLDIASVPSTSPLSAGSVLQEASHDQGHLEESYSYQVATLRRRLSPLVAIDEELADRLSGGIRAGNGGVFVRSGWQTRTIDFPSKGRMTGRGNLEEDALVDDVVNMLHASQEDIKALWEHPVLRALITQRKLKLDEWAEFFLGGIRRISAPGYIPTTDDILHARIQTMGIAEHIFDLDMHGQRVTWHLYDVAGARGQRHSWVPFFDDATAIIFVAPVSAFDQYLEEDPRTNRIDDSLQLFTQICCNPLLKGVHLVLFLNKTDLLQKKIAKGLQVSKYITSYGTRANAFEPVMQYFRAHFLQVHRRHNDNRRVLYTHLTSVVDTTATHRIIMNVRDSIFRGYLKSASLV